jgi:hypothetical protein
MRRGGSGDMPRAMPYGTAVTVKRKFKRGGRVCEIKMSKPQTTETDGVVVSGHVLGKKKSRVAKQMIPRQPDGMMP